MTRHTKPTTAAEAEALFGPPQASPAQIRPRVMALDLAIRNAEASASKPTPTVRQDTGETVQVVLVEAQAWNDLVASAKTARAQGDAMDAAMARSSGDAPSVSPGAATTSKAFRAKWKGKDWTDVKALGLAFVTSNGEWGSTAAEFGAMFDVAHQVYSSVFSQLANRSGKYGPHQAIVESGNVRRGAIVWVTPEHQRKRVAP